MASYRTHILVLLWTAALCGCLGEVEHSNPLDPHAPGFDSVGTLEGLTTRIYPPYPVVEEAEVRLAPGLHVVVSGPEGQFMFRDVPVGVYEISATKDGFESSSKSVRVELGMSVDTVQVRLNGVPSMESVELRSIHISRWFPTQDLYQIEAVVVLEDPDGLSDVDRVWFEIPERGFEHDLTETSVAGRYEALVPAESLPGEDVYALQGDEIVIKAVDQAGFVSTSDPRYILRVIDYTPVAVDPQGQVVVETPTPTLAWEDAARPYAFTYRLDVVRDQANVQTVAATVRDVPSERLTYQLETPLPAGTYFWTVSVVDQHGNRSRSKEAGFIIE